MRRAGSWMFAIALLLGLGHLIPARAADPPPADPDAPQGWRLAPWLQKELDEDSPPPKPKKPAPQPAKDPAKQVAAPAKPKLSPNQREIEENAFLRRMAVCDQLLQIAQEAHDEALERQAQRLNDRAWAIYSRRVAQSPRASGFHSDAQTLDRLVIPPPPSLRLPLNSDGTHFTGISNDTEFVK